jgi:hypothetical protein
MSLALFIDPGDVHVGMAEFREIEPDVWSCVNAWEIGPQLGEEMVQAIIAANKHAIIGYERFRLFGHLAQQQAGSEFRAVQFIGVLKYLHRRTPGVTSQLVVQDPNVQAVAERLAKHRGVPLYSVANKHGNHAKSAELHGIYYFTSRGLSVVSDRMEP